MSEIQYPEKVLPGQPILPIYQPTDGSSSIKYIPGDNVRLESIVFNNQTIPTLISTTLGYVQITDQVFETEEDPSEEVKQQGNIKLVSVIARKEKQYSDNNTLDFNCRSYKAVTPQVGDIVLARVSKMTHQRVNVEILSVLPKSEEHKVNVNDNLQLLNLLPTETGEYFKALIRSQDIRSTERDSVKTWDCYQPGDIIRATVLSLGDGASFYLSTARNDLGVVFARNEEGQLLYPLDWETMVDPSTGQVEKRKCAKPF
ncbi:exosome 3'-_5 exonuclease subunit ski4 (Csl4) [Pichia californica]|uniref:Exosome 3'->5 exonuclease subunit ski4 (Csl4) n=1 Tax=Pichia californica TaxID=460514 RepID=A0A9P7BHX9_9ASCO|nr:exosome 3'->5 exonuclease subunit ski4 (Csl4) [[Candida] californica]KAG0690679.1 exosome 3'->5 exonuclease subunit ski4 (Csl4) [[Candida] californica]